jgi:hypothetical protein
MYVCIHALEDCYLINICLTTYVHTDTRAYIQTSTRTYRHACVHTDTRAYRHACVPAPCLPDSAAICIHACFKSDVYTCVYANICAHGFLKHACIQIWSVRTCPMSTRLCSNSLPIMIASRAFKTYLHTYRQTYRHACVPAPCLPGSAAIHCPSSQHRLCPIGLLSGFEVRFHNRI